MNLGIAIPTYNRTDYLKKLLLSIPVHIKVSVSDNGSFVNDEFVAQFPNATFYHTDRILDVFENWNNAANKVEDEWVLIPSDDDLFFEDSFDIIERYINKYSDSDILIFGHQIIDEHDHRSSGWMIAEEAVFERPHGFKEFKYGVSARMPSIIFKRDMLKYLDYFDAFYKLTAGDSDLIQRALLCGKAAFVPEIISGYRIWPGGLTSKKIATKQWLSEIDYWQKKIFTLAKVEFSKIGDKAELSGLPDEVYARNLLEGIYNLKRSKEGFLNIMNFIKENRYPWKAKFTTHLHIVKSLFIG